MLYRATQDGRVIVESSDKAWSTGEGNGKHFSILALRKDRTLKDELPRYVGAQYATGEWWRNNSRKNKEMEPKEKPRPVVDVTGDGNKAQCCKNNIA